MMYKKYEKNPDYKGAEKHQNGVNLVEPRNKLRSELFRVAQNGVLGELKHSSDSINVRVIHNLHGGMEIIQHRPENKRFNV